MEMLLLKNLLDGGPVLIGIIFMFMMWMKDRKHKTTNEDILAGQKKIHERLGEMKGKISELHDWHDHDDPLKPGVKIWWIQPGIEKALESLSMSITEQTKVMIGMMDVIKDIRRDQNSVGKPNEN